MRAFMSQCSQFKNLYIPFKKGEVEKETVTWMDLHRKECSFCREWSKSVDENREDKR
ncbi:hypothetical protein [Candidatus Clostridium stratigraminis]|uniref:Uncharacterized protein n=1 Tax=Candidatus Clostridium stratigraminis TaxID=3381661 RepID=A0ABW8T232_9CLOT